MTHSVQQIKFELMSYVKEFGGDFTQWSIGQAINAPKLLFEIHEVDPVQDVWLWKPVASAKAANLVIAWMTEHRKALGVSGDDDGDCVFIFKKASNI